LVQRLTSTALLRRLTPLLLTVGALLIAAESWTNVLRYDRYALAPDARSLAQAWVEQTIPSGASFVIEGGESFNRTSNLGPQLRPNAEVFKYRPPNPPPAGAPSAKEDFYWQALVASIPDHPSYILRLVGAA